jgi:hypothetical protein
LPRGAGRGGREGRGGVGWGGQRSQVSPRSLHHRGPNPKLNPKMNPKLNPELKPSQLSPGAPRQAAGPRPHTARPHHAHAIPRASTVRGFLQRPLTARADVEHVRRDGGGGGGGLHKVGEVGGRESSTQSKYLRRIWAGTHASLPQRFPAQSTVSTLLLRDVTWT